MATFKFDKVPGVGIQNKYTVEEKRFPSHAQPQQTYGARELTQLSPGRRGWVPTGTDFSAPRVNGGR